MYLDPFVGALHLQCRFRCTKQQTTSLGICYTLGLQLVSSTSTWGQVESNTLLMYIYRQYRQVEVLSQQYNSYTNSSRGFIDIMMMSMCIHLSCQSYALVRVDDPHIYVQFSLAKLVSCFICTFFFQIMSCVMIHVYSECHMHLQGTCPPYPDLSVTILHIVLHQ